MTQPFSEKFGLPTSTAETKKFKQQEDCLHLKYNIRCAICNKVIGSELTGLPKEGHSHEQII